MDVPFANVRAVMIARLDLAAARGCDAVEPDNADGFETDNRSGVSFGAADQLDYNRFLAAEAHRRGLSVALKNDLAQVPALVADFDFAVNEQCREYDECDAYAPFVAAGKAVFNAEYADRYRTIRASLATGCAPRRPPRGCARWCWRSRWTTASASPARNRTGTRDDRGTLAMFPIYGVLPHALRPDPRRHRYLRQGLGFRPPRGVDARLAAVVRQLGSASDGAGGMRASASSPTTGGVSGGRASLGRATTMTR
ncbi:endo alpha-1,4 polygalactosaminidase [Sphingomonas sp. MMS24-JH45]